MELIMLASCRLRLAFFYCSVAIVVVLPRALTSSRASLRGATLGINSVPTDAANSQSDCSCSPYSLSFVSVSQTTNGGGGRLCFSVGLRGCDFTSGPSSSPSACCSALMGRVDSLSLLLHTSGSSEGRQQWKSIANLEVNGSAWRHWLVSSSAGSSGVVRLSGLAADASTLSGTVVCVVTTAAAATAGEEEVEWEGLCGADAAGGGCRFKVEQMSSGNSAAEVPAAAASAVCPVLGPHHPVRSLAEAAAARRTSPGTPPNARTSKLPRGSKRSKPPRRASPSPSPQPPSYPPPPPPPSYSGFVAKGFQTTAAAGGSRVCGAVTLVSPLDKSGALKYTFGQQVSCDGMAQWMAKNLTDAAAKAGAALAAPFALESCSAAYDPAASPPVVPTVMVCGAFASVAEAAKIQDAVQPLLAQWRFLVLGMTVPVGGGGDDGDHVPYVCPPPGYDIEAMVWGYEDASPVGYLRVRC